MKQLNYEAFNKGFYVKEDHTSKWEKAEFELFEAFLGSNEPLSAEFKNQLPQFAFNVEDGKRDISISYPIDFLVTEIDLPPNIKKLVKEDEVVGKQWERQFKSWFRKLKKDPKINYWLMYITPSGRGLRFVLQVDKPVNNEAEYKEACSQFLQKLEVYGINSDFHDNSTINRGWYFPNNRKYFDVSGDLFTTDLKNIIEEVKSIKSSMPKTSNANSQNNLDFLVEEIEKQQMDITAEYNEWVLIGFALSHELKEEGREYFHRISQFNPDYDQGKCKKQYDACLRSKGSGITLGTLFYLAQHYGINLPKGCNASDERFWFHDKNGVGIDYDAYFKLLHSKGVGRLLMKNEEDIVFIKVDKINKAVKPIDKTFISGFTIQLIDELNVDDTLRKKICNAFLSDSKILMPKNYSAVRSIDINFMKDDEETMYFFFKNCYVSVDKDNVSTHSYEQMKGYIWESQIIPREFITVPAKEIRKKSEFYTFIRDVSRDMDHENFKRFRSLRTVIGYLLHTFKDPAVPKSIVFMDASLDKDTKGRTGKGIVKTGLSKMRKLVTEDGKRFDFRSQFSFSQVTLDTDILFIDDVTNRFDFMKLFSVLTEGVVVERKHKDKFHMSFENTPKILITTNYAIQGSGDSFEGRIFEYEFSDYYNLGNTPKIKFGHLLFDQWDQEQWNLFDNFMLLCCKFYLRRGLIESEFINLNLKKVIANTGFAFVEYLSETIKLNKKYNKAEVFDDLCNEHPSYSKWGQRTFTINLRKYYKLEKCEILESRSGKERSFKVIRVSDDLK